MCLAFRARQWRLVPWQEPKLCKTQRNTNTAPHNPLSMAFVSGLGHNNALMIMKAFLARLQYWMVRTKRRVISTQKSQTSRMENGIRNNTESY